ncbi:MAG: hypothetical protein ACYDC1_23715 [Limisphaerales bacterium]
MRELIVHPRVERVHDRPALLLVEGQAGGVGKLLVLGLGVDAVDLPQALDHIHEHPAAVQQAIEVNGFELVGLITRAAVAHLEWLVRAGGPPLKQLVQVLAGVFVAGEKERHRMRADLRDKVGGENAGSFLTFRRRGAWISC